MTLKNKEKVEISTSEVKIYVEIAHIIFKKCFTIGDIDEKRGWPKTLSEALTAEFPDSIVPDAKALSDLYNRITRLKNENITFKDMGISERTFDLLGRFALIDDFKTFNRNFKGIKVFYTPKPFSIFNLLRVPGTGFLFRDDNWNYVSDTGAIIKNKNVTAVATFSMPGDRIAYWIKVVYNNESIQKTAYFAQVEPESTVVTLLKPTKLIDFFESLIDRKINVF